MSSVVRSVLGAAFLLTGASATMAQYANPQYGGSAQVAPQASASTAASAPSATYAAEQPQKPAQPRVVDKSDVHGGHDPNSYAGTRSFWDDKSNQY